MVSCFYFNAISYIAHPKVDTTLQNVSNLVFFEFSECYKGSAYKEKKM